MSDKSWAEERNLEIGGMDFGDFRVGAYFITETGRWRVTEIDTEKQLVHGVRIDPNDGVESVFEDYDFGGCEPWRA